VVSINGLTEAETSATASVMGIVPSGVTLLDADTVCDQTLMTGKAQP
jgi:hypothetical protein